MSLLARMALAGEEGEAADSSLVGESGGTGLYASAVDFLREAVHTIYDRPDQEPGPHRSGGIGWREYPGEQIVELTPPTDLKDRLAVLPQSYLADREVTTRLRLATSTTKGTSLLRAALRLLPDHL